MAWWPDGATRPRPASLRTSCTTWKLVRMSWILHQHVGGIDQYRHHPVNQGEGGGSFGPLRSVQISPCGGAVTAGMWFWDVLMTGVAGMCTACGISVEKRCRCHLFAEAVAALLHASLNLRWPHRMHTLRLSEDVRIKKLSEDTLTQEPEPTEPALRFSDQWFLMAFGTIWHIPEAFFPNPQSAALTGCVVGITYYIYNIYIIYNI